MLVVFISHPLQKENMPYTHAAGAYARPSINTHTHIYTNTANVRSLSHAHEYMCSRLHPCSLLGRLSLEAAVRWRGGVWVVKLAQAEVLSDLEGEFSKAL